MSKLTYLHRYFTIIKTIQAKPFIQKVELQSIVEKSLEQLLERAGKAKAGKGKRTLERDFNDIYTLFGIQIEHCRKKKGYHIVQSIGGNIHARRQLEAFNVFAMLNLGQDLQAFIQPENHQAKGTEHFGEILSAIKNEKQVHFTYHKFWDEEASSRIVEPYLLKEALNRWYLIAKDVGSNQYVKHFALDRMSDVTVSEISYTPPANKLYENIYQHCFGIDGPHNDTDELQEIILSFDHYQGKYIKTLPLHHSQKILVDTEAELRISLHLYITRDLEMQLLSYGEKVKVLQPKSLANSIASELKITLKQYKK